MAGAFSFFKQRPLAGEGVLKEKLQGEALDAEGLAGHVALAQGDQVALELGFGGLLGRGPGGGDELLDGPQVGRLGPLAVTGHGHVAHELLHQRVGGAGQGGLDARGPERLGDIEGRGGLAGRGRGRRRGAGRRGGVGGGRGVALLTHDAEASGVRRDAAVPPAGLMSANADGPTGYRTFDQQSPVATPTSTRPPIPTAKPFSPTDTHTRDKID